MECCGLNWISSSKHIDRYFGWYSAIIKDKGLKMMTIVLIDRRK